MDILKLGFILVFPPTMCFKYQWEETLVKRPRGEPVMTPYETQICSNETQNVITLIVCKIRTQRSRGGECRLLYQHGQDFVHECDSRFMLMMENETVFLHLTGLTAEDSGRYTCECAKPDGTFILYVNVTVEDDVTQKILNQKEAQSSTKMPNSIYLIGVAVVIMTGGVILGISYQWGRLRSEASGQSVHETPSSLEHEHDPDDPYTSLHQPANDLYQTLSSDHHHSQKNSAQKLSQLHYQEMNQSCKISEKPKARSPSTVVCHIV